MDGIDTFFQAPDEPPGDSPAPTATIDQAAQFMESLQGDDNPALNKETFGEPPRSEEPEPVVPEPPASPPSVEAQPPEEAEAPVDTEPVPLSPEAPLEIDRVAQLEQQLRQSQQQIQQLAANGQSSEQIAQALIQADQMRRQAEQAAQQLEPPKPKDLDALISDPEAIVEYLGERDRHLIQQVHAGYAPMVQQIQQISALAPTLLGQTETLAAERGRALLEQQGVNLDFEVCRDGARQVILNSSSNPLEVQANLMNDQVWAEAARMYHQHTGQPAPVKDKPEAPPTVASSKKPQPSKTPLKKSESVRAVEKMFGIDFDDSMLADHNRSFPGA